MAPRRACWPAFALSVAAVFVCSLATTAPVAAAFKTGNEGNDVVPGSYIIQVNTSSAALSKRGMTPFTVRLLIQLYPPSLSIEMPVSKETQRRSAWY